jgi:hypothetical protein
MQNKHKILRTVVTFCDKSTPRTIRQIKSNQMAQSYYY